MSILCVCCRKDNASPEDVEYYECQQEMMQDLIYQYNEIERIIGMFDNPFKDLYYSMKPLYSITSENR